MLLPASNKLSGTNANCLVAEFGLLAIIGTLPQAKASIHDIASISASAL